MKIFHHSSDLDGRACGAILSRKFPKAEVIAYAYWYNPANTIERIEPDEPVIFADITPNMETLRRVFEITKDVTIIDHHATSFDDLVKEGLIDQVQGIQTRDGIGACALVWEWCHSTAQQKSPVPFGIQCIAEYDDWQRKEANVHFQFGIQTFNTFPTNWIWDKIINDDREFVSGVLTRGRHVWAWVSNWYRQVIRSYMIRGTVEHGGKTYSAVFINQGRVDSAIFDSLEEKFDLYIRGTFGRARRWTISLTTDRDDIDVGLIAKDYEGGGRAKTAGMIVTELTDFFQPSTADNERYAQLPKTDETHP